MQRLCVSGVVFKCVPFARLLARSVADLFMLLQNEFAFNLNFQVSAKFLVPIQAEI